MNDERLSSIKSWLKTGSINIFGLPMSGKDTVGVRLAETLGAKFLSSGLIIRAVNKEKKDTLGDDGKLIPSNVFYDIVLPYFERRELWESPLILSSVGRWSGEEGQVINVAEGSGHPIKAVILLNVSEAEVEKRWHTAHDLGARHNSRGERPDDATTEVFEKRIQEFNHKTVPVLRHYQELGLLLRVPAHADRETVFNNVITALYDFSQGHHQ